MSRHWEDWATKALVALESLKAEDEETQEYFDQTKESLEHVRDTGYEPYVTLKALVYQHLTED